MDYKRKKKSKKLPVILGVCLSLAAVTATGAYVLQMDFTSRRVDRDSLLIGTVERGNLEIKVSANGMLLAEDEQWLASESEGRVTGLHVQPGDTVKKGQVLVELSNSSLVAASEEAREMLEGARAERISYQVDIENALLNQKNIVLRSKFDFEKASLELKANKSLIEKNIISEIDYQRSQLNVDQAREIYDIEKERLKKAEDNLDTQLQVKEARVNQLANALARAEERVRSLQVRSNMDGVVQEMNLEIGQRLQPGSIIGRLARQDRLYAELKVPARQSSEVTVGQRVEIDTRNGLIDGVVDRIDPTVVDGAVAVDVKLVSELPKSSRPELAVEGTIYVAEIKNSLYTGKPSYVKTNSFQSIYKLGEEGNYAERMSIRVGQASVNRIEILDGLKEGDRIILSDSGSWQDYDRILLK